MVSQKAFRELPENYKLIKDLDLIKEKKIFLLLSLASLVLLVVFWGMFTFLVGQLRPGLNPGSGGFTVAVLNQGNFVRQLLIFLGVIFTMVFLHEAVHGLCFWLFTGGSVKFGFKGGYAYAGAPDWFISKWPYLVVSLAPLVVITVLGFLALLFLPQNWIFPILLLISLNGSGSVGDLYAFQWVLRMDHDVLIQDFGERIKVYASSEINPEG